MTIFLSFAANAFALSADGFYTKSELEQIYEKKYKSKIPYALGTATVTEVSFAEDGTVTVTGIIDPLYFKMPKMVRIQLESEGLKRLEKSYCKKVKKKQTVSKIREIVGILKTEQNKVERTLEFSPDMCEE